MSRIDKMGVTPVMLDYGKFFGEGFNYEKASN